MGPDLGILVFTLLTAAAATALIVPLGLALGYALARGRGPWKVGVETVVTLPLVLPPTAVGLVLLRILSRQSPVGRALEGAELLFTWKAVVLASAVMAFPLFLRTVKTAFEEVDPRLVAIARSLGKTPLQAFFRVVLPLAWRGVLAGTLLAFCRALGEFGATILIAGNIPGRTQTLALAIFQRVELGHDEDAFPLLAMTVAIAFFGILATELLTRRRTRRTAA